ncbi:adenosylcobinamide-GDP ribazoletransferase [Flavobacterium procerum]|uniref:adenosylcobinamide-GDP ribazoletransferase n=1 Tax=Flavobacterium procerum TaxID=1455569 RepID=UPI0035E6BA0B
MAVFLFSHFIFHHYFFKPTAVILAIIASVLTTGAFHEDGFADVCEGPLRWLDKGKNPYDYERQCNWSLWSYWSCASFF